MDKLTKKEVLWIFAVKDRCEKEHYNKYYGVYEGEPRAHTLYIITKSIVEKTNSWREVVMGMETNRHLHRMMNERKAAKELGRPLDYDKDKTEPYLEEWLWYGVRYFIQFTTRDWLDKNAPKKWEQWVDDEREYWNKIEKDRKENNNEED